MDEWKTLVRADSRQKHGELVSWLKSEYGLGHGNANLIVTMARRADDPVSGDTLIDAQYAGAKAALRPIADLIIDAARRLGDDVEVAPKKTSVSLRRSKQFAVVEATSAKRIELGLNLRGTAPTGRLEEAGGMCTHRVRVSSVDDVDAQVLGWLREAYDRA